MSDFVYGINTCKQYLKKPQTIEQVYLSDHFKNQAVLKLLKDQKIKYEKKDSKFLDKLSNYGNHQGIILKIANFKYYELDDLIRNDNQGLIVLLDGISDPHNLGAILRICDACGVDGVIIGKHRCASLNGTVAKVSTGAIDSVKVCQVTNLANTLKKLKEKGYWIVGSDVDPKAQVYTQLKYDFPTVLVIGSEGEGMSNLVKKQCDFLVYLPMLGKVTSLNASVATGVLLYEVVNKRNTEK